MSEAIIARISVQPHPNADRLQIGTVLGHQVVVGMNIQEGDLGIFFPEGLQLSTEYASANDLVRRIDPETGQRVGGFFEESRRVRAQKFRGVKSEGFWMPVSSLAFTGITVFKEGERLHTLNKVRLCNKYFTEATQNVREGREVQRGSTRMFAKHFDTDQLRLNLHAIKERDLVVLTLKMHGTSQRVGRVKDVVKLPLWKRWVNFFCPVFPTEEWTYLVGTRNVILDPHRDGFYSANFRERAAWPFLEKLHKGETIYYEVVGFERGDRPIMGRHAGKGETQKEYGREITYSYGCEDGECRVFVYRITMTNEDGHTVELPWTQVKARCRELSVAHVPELNRPFHYCGDAEALLKLATDLSDGRDPVGLNHPREGVCVRVEGERTRIFKLKGFTFCVLEGIVKDNPDYVDVEEVA